MPPQSFWDLLGQELGSGLGEGVSRGLPEGLKAIMQEKQEALQERAKRTKELENKFLPYARELDIDITSPLGAQAFDFAQEFVDQGYSIPQAFILANQRLGKEEEKIRQEEGPTGFTGFVEKTLKGPENFATKAKENLELPSGRNLSSEQRLQAFGYGPGIEDIEKIDFQNSPFDKILNISESQFESLNPKQKKQLSKRISNEERRALALGVASKVPFTKGLVQKAMKKQGREKIYEFFPDVLGAGSTVGELAALPTYAKAFGSIFGPGKTALGRILKEGSMFGSYGQLQEASNTGQLSPKEFAKDFILGSAFGGAIESLKLIPSLRNAITRGAKKFNTSPEVFVQEGVKEAEKAGIDVSKAYQGEPKAAKELAEYLGRIQKSPPKAFTERISLIAEEAAPGEEFVARREALSEQPRYARRTQRVREEVAEEKGRREEVKEKERKKTPAVQQREEHLKLEAEREIPTLERQLESTEKGLSQEKSELRAARKQKVSPEKLETLKNNVDRLEANQRRLANELESRRYQARTGREFRSDFDLEQYAENKANSIAEDIKTKGLKYTLKENKLDELAEQYRKRRTIPGTERLPEDTNTRIYKALRDAYRDKLQEVNRELMFASPAKEKALEEEAKALKKLVKQAEGRRLVQRRRQALQDLGKTLERQNKLKGRLPETKVSKAVKERWNLKKAAEKPEGAAKEIISEAKKVWEQIQKRMPNASPKQKKKLLSFSLSKLLKNLTGISISTAALSALIQETTGADLPLSPVKFIRWVSLNAKSSYANTLSKSERDKYYRNLKDKGMSTAKINKIKRKAREKRTSLYGSLGPELEAS